MGIKVITPPAAMLTLAELRLHLKLDGDPHPDDALIAAQLTAAHEYCQHYTGRSFGSQTLELALDAFPAGGIMLRQGPVTAISSIKFMNEAQIETTINTPDFTLDEYSQPPWVIPSYGKAWPATLDCVNAVKVRYVAGAAALPGAVRAAMLLIVGHLYSNRESVAPGSLATVPMGADALLDTVKDWSL